MDEDWSLDQPGVGETERGGLSRWVREVELALALPVMQPVRRLWHRLNGATLEVTELAIGLPRWPAGQQPLTLLHLSDLHVTADVDPCQWLRRLAGISVDVVAVTGDLIQDDSGTEASVRFLAALRRQSRLGVYTTLGNHDYLGYGTTRQPNGVAVQHRWPNDVPALCRALDGAGITLLDNRAVSLASPPDAGLWLAGVGDPYTGHDDMDASLAAVPRGAAVIMLAHTPDQLPSAAARRVDLMLGGHTHGGQVRLPLVGPLRTATIGSLRLASGYAVYRETRCYISRGLGSAALPLRMLCRPEATVLTIGPLAGVASGGRRGAGAVSGAVAAALGAS